MFVPPPIPKSNVIPLRRCTCPGKGVGPYAPWCELHGRLVPEKPPRTRLLALALGLVALAVLIGWLSCRAAALDQVVLR